MADLKDLGVDVSFKREFFYDCIEEECKKFIKSYKDFKKGNSSFDEREMLYYIGELKKSTEMFEKNGSEEDKELEKYYKFRKEKYGY